MSPPTTATIERRVIVEGRVQGVGFRAATQAEARRRPELRGWVRNLSDGRVEAVFQGPLDDVLAMVSWCRQGPPSARVDRLEVIEAQPGPELGSFRIRHDEQV